MFEEYIGEKYVKRVDQVLREFCWQHDKACCPCSTILTITMNEKMVDDNQYLLDFYIELGWGKPRIIENVFFHTNRLYGNFKCPAPRDEDVFSDEEKAEAVKIGESFLEIVTGKKPGALLKLYRDYYEWSREKLAEQLGISVEEYDAMENGDITLTRVYEIEKIMYFGQFTYPEDVIDLD